MTTPEYKEIINELLTNRDLCNADKVFLKQMSKKRALTLKQKKEVSRIAAL